MTMYVGPIATRTGTPPPGITGTDWCYMVSDSSLLDLTGFLTTNLPTIGQAPTNVRTPAVGSVLTYVGLDATMRAAAIAAGATAAPTDGLTRAQGFDCPTGLWE